MKKIIATILLSTFVLTSFAVDGFLSGLKNSGGKKDKLLVIFYKPDRPYCLWVQSILINELQEIF